MGEYKMVTSNLEKILCPNSIAVIGASNKKGSIGHILMKNLTELGYIGKVYPVNFNYSEILGYKTYQKVAQLPEVVDLAIIATPAKTVPDIIEQCGKMGIVGVIIISTGFKEFGSEGKDLEEKIQAIKKKYNMRIVGPNSLGIIRPSINLNATFTNKIPKQGNIAFISQSGALGSAILDLAANENIGFSNFVSIGSMIDIDFGDLIDYFGTDPKTRSILMYIEGITNARKFMSAARHFARTKPIIVVKAGKFSETAKAVAIHTGSQEGEDTAYDAAFKRVGIVRVEEIGDLFNCAEVLGVQPLPRGSKLVIITNAGGAGIMAADALIAGGGRLAKLDPKTVEKLDKSFPPHWSKTNPIDILGDAKSDRYEKAITACFEDKNVDGLLIIFIPQGLSDSIDVAKCVSELCERNKYVKPVLTSFMGYETVDEANRILNQNRIPTYSTPEQAIKTYLYMNQYKRNLELLYQTPEELPVDSSPPKRPINVIIAEAVKENRENLTEIESKQILENYRIPFIQTLVAETEDEAVFVASRIGYPVKIKIFSPNIIHSSDVEIVAADINSDKELREAFDRIVKLAKAKKIGIQIHGVIIQPIIKKRGYRMKLQAKTDSLFGPMVMLGLNDVSEVFENPSVGLPPLNQVLARRIMEDMPGYRLLKGSKKMPPANLKRLEEIVVRFSQLLVDFPQIKEIDIDPLFISKEEALALYAKILIYKTRVATEFDPHEHLVISPYPKKYERSWKMRDGGIVLLRPIKPEDEPMWLEMFKNFSEQSIRYRFFQIIKDTPHEVRVRYSNIDYDRELGIVAELKEDKRKILGVVRLIIEPDGKTGEIAFIIADPWQGLGLGSKMVDYMIEICKDKHLETVYSFMLPDNQKAIRLLKKMGFKIEQIQDVKKATLNLKEN
jgi:acetyltransferase